MIKVACALIYSETGLLLAQRKDNEKWEFPGGKLEKNETFEEAIKRERFEELGIRIKIQDLINLDLVNHTYDKKNFIMMSVFCIEKWSGKIRNKDTKDFSWLNIKGPYPKKFLDGGLLILKRLKDGYYEI